MIIRDRIRCQPLQSTGHCVSWPVQARRSRCSAIHGRGSWVVKNQKVKGLGANVSDTQKQCARLLTNFSNHQGPLCKSNSVGARGRVSPGYGPYRASFSPLLFTCFLFLFLPDLGNPYKLQKNDKNMRLILLDSQISLVFNKNSSRIFSPNKELISI